MNRIIFYSAIIWSLLIACGNTAKQPDQVANTATEAQKSVSKNVLSMKINGVEWVADHDVVGAFHPKGYNKLIMIAGKKGSKDKGEQFFNINIYNTDGPGTYNFKHGNPDLSEAQMGNWSPETFLCGSMMGFDMRVKATTASTKPDVIEATFEGEMTCNSGEVFKITEGKFYYHE